MEDLNKKVGQVCLNFSSIELMVSVFTSRMLSDDSAIGAIITSEMSFQNLVKAFDSLIRHKRETQGHVNQLNDLIKRITASEQKRNIVVHSLMDKKIRATIFSG